MIKSTPSTFSPISTFFSYPEWDTIIILFIPLPCSSFTYFLAVSTSSRNLMSSPGLEDSLVFFTTSSPIIPMFCPPTFFIMYGFHFPSRMLPLSGTTLAETTGIFKTSKNDFKSLFPSSNSWFPNVKTSKFIAFISSASAFPSNNV